MSAIMKANILNTVVSEQSLESLSDGIGFDRNNVVCLFLVWDCLNSVVDMYGKIYTAHTFLCFAVVHFCPAGINFYDLTAHIQTHCFGIDISEL